MALFHLSVTQTKRSAGQSAIASAAYRAGERLYSEYYGEYSDYTRKGGVICSDILLPSHAPPEYADRQTLWNAVEKAERGKNAQLAYSFDIALQNEFSLEENIALARRFLLENFVSRGMVVDFAVHQPDREEGGIPNPHFHVLCPIRPIEQDGKWGLKQRRVYELDEDGNRIRDQNGEYVFNAVPTTDWGSPETLEHWRQTWAELCNAKFAEKGLDVRIDHRSYYIYFDDIDRANYKQYTTWEKCTLRKWLNDDFIDAAFSPEEQKKIQTTYVTPGDNPNFAGIYDTHDETMDKVFLLSIDEVEDYLPSSESKKCSATDYAAACGAVITGSSRAEWWLRTPGKGFYNASYVTSVYGWVNGDGNDIRNRMSVRPALWIDLDS